MKTRLFYIISLLCLIVGISLTTACSDDIPEPTYFEEIPDEHVVSTIENVPGFVCNEQDGYTFISCSEYVDEYLAYPYPKIDPNNYLTMTPPEFPDYSDWKTYPKDTSIVYDADWGIFLRSEITKELIGVTTKEFREYDIPLGAKVYLSASITNNIDEYIINAFYSGIRRKAYLLDLKERQ